MLLGPIRGEYRNTTAKAQVTAWCGCLQWPVHFQSKLVGKATHLALFNSRTSILIQKRPFKSGNLNSETPGDSRNVFLHWGNVLGVATPAFIFAGCTACPNFRQHDRWAVPLDPFTPQGPGRGRILQVCLLHSCTCFVIVSLDSVIAVLLHSIHRHGKSLYTCVSTACHHRCCKPCALARRLDICRQPYHQAL